MKFLDGLSEDIQKNLLDELRVLWTHASTGIEGNTLTLGETAFVLREGLTISGKPLKDHRDVEGHARAVDLLLELLKRDAFTKEDLFNLHRIVINEQIFDVYKPIGHWKNENNSTIVVLGDKQEIIEFANFWEVPALMARWLDLLNLEVRVERKTEADILGSYVRLHASFTSIHPFWDGNGRVARLVSNIPCLKAGYPPIIVDKAQRYEYILALAEYTSAHGVPSTATEIVHDDSSLDRLIAVCRQSWQKSLALVRQAHAVQQNRDRNKARMEINNSS
jgi:Fic family protein